MFSELEGNIKAMAWSRVGQSSIKKNSPGTVTLMYSWQCLVQYLTKGKDEYIAI